MTRMVKEWEEGGVTIWLPPPGDSVSVKSFPGQRPGVGTMKKHMCHEILYRAIRAALGIQRRLDGLVEQSYLALSGLALHALDVAHLHRLTADIYGARGGYYKTDMFDWEQRWFAEDLPAPPARILVGGAGTGREALYLSANGYEVVAFEPAASFVEKGQEHVKAGRLLAFRRGGYEDLVPDGGAPRRFTAQLGSHGPYDAVLLGWGSFTHLASRQARVDALLAFRRLCPHGPLLLSCWMRGPDELTPPRRSWLLGAGLGGRWADRDSDERNWKADVVTGRFGYAHYFPLDEIEVLAEATGYAIARRPSGLAGSVPHITFLPARGPQ
jgi:SAM-dependent methyltransferase